MTTSDGDENVTKAIGLLSKTTGLQVHHAFLYSSLLLLQDYAVEMPKFLFCGGREPTQGNDFLLLFLNIDTIF